MFIARVLVSVAVLILASSLVESGPRQESATSIRAKMQQGLELARSGDLEGAEALFREIVQNNPQHGPARLQLGRLALTRQDFDAAIEHLVVATTTQPQPQRLYLAWHLLGRARFMKEDYGAARMAFEKSLEKTPNFIPARKMLAEIAEIEGDYFGALASYLEVIGLETEPGPDTLEARVRAANLARIMGAHDLAECHLREAIDAQPEEGYLHYLLAVILKDAGRNDAALASCERAVALGFEEAPVFVTLGDLYFETMDLTRSIRALGKAVELDPAAAESIASFALSSLTTEDFAALLTLLEKHLETHPDNVNTLYSLGVMCVRENDLEKAKEYLLRSKKLAPDHAQVHYNLGMVYMREGRNEEGQAEMARFQELKANEAEDFDKHNMAHAKRVEAKDALEAGEPEKAVPIYLHLIKEALAEIEDLVELGRAYMRTGNSTEAFAWFERTIDVDPYNKDAHEGLAQAAEALGKQDLARRSRERFELLSATCPEKP